MKTKSKINKAKGKIIKLLSSFWDFFYKPISKHGLPRVPWTSIDGAKMIFLSSLFLILFSYGGSFLASLIWDKLTVATFIMENYSKIFVGALAFQVFTQYLFLFIYSYRTYHVHLKDFGFRKINFWKVLFMGFSFFIFGAVLQNIYFSITSFFGIPNFADGSEISLMLKNGMIPPYVLLIFAGVVAPIMEELMFRGFLLASFLRNMHPVWAIILSSIFFATAHFQILFVPIYFFMGCLLGVVYLRTKSLWPGIAFHAINNSIALSFIIMS